MMPERLYFKNCYIVNFLNDDYFFIIHIYFERMLNVVYT